MKTNSNVFRMIKYFFRCKRATIYAGIMCVLGLVVGIVTPICNRAIQDDIIPNKNVVGKYKPTTLIFNYSLTLNS